MIRKLPSISIDKTEIHIRRATDSTFGSNKALNAFVRGIVAATIEFL